MHFNTKLLPGKSNIIIGNFKMLKIFKNIIDKTIIFLLIILIVAIPLLGHAQPFKASSDLLKKQAEKATLVSGGGKAGNEGMAKIIGNIIYSILGFLGVICLLLMIVAGIMWMTAGGNEENAKKAKDIIKATFLGLMVILSAYAVTVFVVNELLDILGPPPRPQIDDIYRNDGAVVPDNEVCCVIVVKYNYGAPEDAIELNGTYGECATEYSNRNYVCMDSGMCTVQYYNNCSE